MYLVVAVLLWFFIAFIGVSYVALLIFGVSYFDWLEEALEYCREKVIPFKRSLAFLAESLKVNRLLPRSGYKSCLEVGAITGVIDLPRGDEIFDIVGAEVTAENRLQFNDGATDVSYKVSVPDGASVRKTTVQDGVILRYDRK